MTAAARHTFLRLAALALAAGLLTPAAASAAKPPTDGHPRIVFVRCSSEPFPCESHTIVNRKGRLLVGAGGMSRNAKVEFPVRTPGGRKLRRAIGGHFRTATRIVVRVPGDAITGRIRVVNPGRRFSNGVRIGVKRTPVVKAPGGTPAGQPSAFDGNGMWIWYLSKSEAADPVAIAAQARAHSVSTVFVKSADGTGAWSQFTAEAVAALKAQGLKVCGWQFVYGNSPVGEATAAAVAAQNGADCFVIDAEGAYEGKYRQAQLYMEKLRELVGPDFPIGLTSFPYVDYHPGLPYSVFMGPGGATFNLPQVYWKTIGDTVDASLAHTYTWNVPYETAIFPLGQTYDHPQAADVRRFRQLSEGYGARGVSWWVWQFATDSDWDAVGAPLGPLQTAPLVVWPLLKAGAGTKVGSRGDLVVWAQQYLVGAGALITPDGAFGPGTASAVRDFQFAHGLPQTGQLDAETWRLLLNETPVPVDWVARAEANASGARAAAAASRSTLPAGPNGPSSAGLPAKRYEIPPGPR